MTIDDAVEILANTYESLITVAQGLPVDAEEAELAFEDATPDTTEYVCLQALVQTHPIPVIAPEE